MKQEKLNQVWRLQWISSIFEFANTNLQHMSWIEGPKAKWPRDKVHVSCFAECFCTYFDDLGLDRGYSEFIENKSVSKNEAEAAITFHNIADNYQEPSDDPKIILKDSNWLKVVDEAGNLWNYIKKSTTSKRELELIESLEKDFGQVGI